ncbi:trypsin-like peptidase domain-containing protein [Actinomycetes bacterium KLBMP 9797]
MRRVVLGASVAVVLVLTAVVAFRWGTSDAAPDQVSASPTPTAEDDEQLSVGEIYAVLTPSVVSIKTGDGSGTGVIANADGMILTAHHVIEGATSIEVSFADGTKSAATVAAADPASDIAALTATTLPSVVVPTVLGGGVAVGDQVVAIGDQLGLARSTTSGVVSGLGRTAAREAAPALQGLIQFDAAVNPGSSGGPLVNARGETVGIVVALANPTEADTFVGVGFAVPIGAAVGAGSGDGAAPQI